MTPQRWSRIRELFGAALETPELKRLQFLESACGADTDLRAEVERLLAGNQESSWQSPAATFFPVAEDLVLGDTVAHYRIDAKLGEGGMGVVYRATDTKLDREVAIKILPGAFTRDPERLARFEREAKVLAALNHANIAQIYAVEQGAIVMELVEGETLQRPLPFETGLRYARQIAEALEAAHEKGIVHRDLKPANILVTPDGVVKLLDFGLAAIVAASASGDPLISPTITMEATKPGVIMGTVAYMSPEQAAGKPVDKRADIWSFGVVLWEIVTGRRMFEAETVSQTLADVLNGPIEFDKLPQGTPAPIRRLLQRCLERNVKNRLRDIGEARIAIEGALAGATEPVAKVVRGGRRMWLGWCAAAVMTAVLAPVAFLHLREKTPAAATPLRFPIPAPENATLGSLLDVSPDGHKLAFLASGRLWVHFFESGESRNLTEARGTPFWSPDSRFIGYPFSGKLRKIEATGGVPQTVTELRGMWGGGAWSRDDLIVFSSRDALFRVPAVGGVPVQVTAVDPTRDVAHVFPSFLPDGRHFVYTRRMRDPNQSAVCISSVNETPGQQNFQSLTRSPWGSHYVPSGDPVTGYLLFVRDNTLMAQPFDNRRLILTGQASPIAEPIGDGRAFSVSDNGVLVYHRSEFTRQLTWYDQQGKKLGTAGDSRDYRSPSLSPDASRASLIRGGLDQASSIWLIDLPRGASTRFSFGSESHTSPVWSADGGRIVFSSNRDGPFDLYVQPSSGGKDAEILLKSYEDKFATSWSADGRLLLYTVFDAKTKNDIWVLPMQGERKPVPFLVTEFNEVSARISPDGHWVAYTSDESGRSEVYVRPFSMNSGGLAAGPGKWVISSGGGDLAAWRNDGRELYYQSLDLRLMAVEIAVTPVFRAGEPRQLALKTEGDRGRTWDSSDGKRFILLEDNSKPEPYTVVLNWQSGLKK